MGDGMLGFQPYFDIQHSYMAEFAAIGAGDMYTDVV
jgi:hypothetical protein